MPFEVTPLGLLPTRRRILIAAALSCWTAAHAIDNPDAPDYNAAFLERARPYEERLSQASSASETTAAASAYSTFLDAELNRAYQDLLARMDAPDTRQALVQAQREWLRFRDAELRFIDRNWTPQNFGSSFALSRADYRHRLVKQRVSTLLAYLQNYPARPVRGK
ncbi:lysozyme inhibitor LprI family protein [Pseudorhodoferax sp.]|uniref:lysozyme inhibitor LprI family protein n=1 Tax=Pseudorhodoferax sp. TaxID=1993553 RepID=UPI0039E66E79